MARRWKESSVRALFNGIGAYGFAWFQRKAGQPHPWPQERSIDAIVSKIRREYGGGGITRGVYTVNQIVLSTGYEPSHLRRAQSALNQKWKRTSLRGNHLITDEQMHDILEWLKHDYWCVRKRLYGCVWCATSTRPPKGIGLCSRCFYRHRRLCAGYGIPWTVSGQLTLLEESQSLDSDKNSPHGTFVEEAKRRLDRGIALEEYQLEWMILVQPERS